jgi:hypothetical protein
VIKKVYQIYFKDDQLTTLHKNCIPVCNKNDITHEFEYGVMRRTVNKKIFNDCDLLGFLSWKFEQKSRIKLEDFYKLINDNSGYDCYAFNPFPHEITDFNNIWLQGDLCHNGIVIITNRICKECYDIDYRLQDRIHTLENASFCNYSLGNKKYWTQYIKFMEKARHWMIQKNEEYNNLFFNPKDYYNLSFYPYIMERLWTEFIHIKEINYKIFTKKDII